MDIGKKLRELRKQNDLTLEDLASRSELTKGFLSQVERNLTAPSIATLEDILEALGRTGREIPGYCIHPVLYGSDYAKARTDTGPET